jgi:hypothetical protein
VLRVCWRQTATVSVWTASHLAQRATVFYVSIPPAALTCPTTHHHSSFPHSLYLQLSVPPSSPTLHPALTLPSSPAAADVSKEISASYGVLVTDPEDALFGAALRGLFIIDPKGTIRLGDGGEGHRGHNQLWYVQVCRRPGCRSGGECHA